MQTVAWAAIALAILLAACQLWRDRLHRRILQVVDFAEYWLLILFLILSAYGSNVFAPRNWHLHPEFILAMGLLCVGVMLKALRSRNPLLVILAASYPLLAFSSAAAVLLGNTLAGGILLLLLPATSLGLTIVLIYLRCTLR